MNVFNSAGQSVNLYFDDVRPIEEAPSSDLVSALKKAIEDWHSAEQKADVLHQELSEIADLLSKEGF